MQTHPWGQDPNESFVDFREYLTVLRRRWRLIAVVTLLALGVSIAYTFAQTPMYAAGASVLVRPPATSVTDLQPRTVNLQTEKELILSTAVATIAQRRIGAGAAPESLLRRVSVDVPADAQVLNIEYRAPGPEGARLGAQSFAEAYLEYREELARRDKTTRAAAVKRRIAALRAQGRNGGAVALLESKLAEIRATTIDPGEITTPATTPAEPASPSLPTNVALGALVGLFLGVVISYTRERVVDRLRSRLDLEQTLNVPVMTVIPKVSDWKNRQSARVVALDSPRSPAAEAYRTLRTSMLVAASEHDAKTILVTSALAGDGKTTVAANLAVVLAQAGRRVVLLSADLRKPRLHEFFGLNNREGLADILAGGDRPWEALQACGVDNLWVLPSGHHATQPAELLQSTAMQEILAEQRAVVDFIIMDCPPALAVADALVLAPLVDGVLFVADAGETPRGAVLEARDLLNQVGGKLLGAVFNNVKVSGGIYSYYGYRQYGDAPAPDTEGGKDMWVRPRRDTHGS